MDPSFQRLTDHPSTTMKFVPFSLFGRWICVSLFIMYYPSKGGGDGGEIRAVVVGRSDGGEKLNGGGGDNVQRGEEKGKSIGEHR